MRKDMTIVFIIYKGHVVGVPFYFLLRYIAHGAYIL
jgi:hypothetical protein